MEQPFLKAFLFCDTAAPRPDGTLDVRGVWQQLGVSQVPGRYPVGLFLCWANLDRPRYRMEVTVRVPEAPEPFRVAIPVETSGNPRLDWMNTAVLDLVVAREGDILFEVSLDGQSYGSCRLPVVLREGAPG